MAQRGAALALRATPGTAGQGGAGGTHMGAGMPAPGRPRRSLQRSLPLAGPRLLLQLQRACLVLLWGCAAGPRLNLGWAGLPPPDPAQQAGWLEYLVVALAAWRLAPAPGALVPLAAWLCAALALAVPASMAASLALLVLALAQAAASPRGARSGAWLFAGLAACSLWWGMGTRLTGGLVLQAEALAVTALLHPWVDGIARAGNVVGVPGGHHIAVLAGCSTLYGLPLQLLALAGLTPPAARQALPRRAILLLALYATANLARLTLLALSDGWYASLHGPAGLMGFDALAVCLPVLLAPRAALGAVPAPARPHAASPGRVALAAAICAVLLSAGAAWRTLGGLAAPAPQSREAMAVAALRQVLPQAGWEWREHAAIAGDGSLVAQIFTRPGCDGALRVAVVPRPAETAEMVRSVMASGGGGPVLWLDAGQVSASPALGAHARRELFGALAARLPGGGDRVMPLLALRLPAGGGAACTSLPGTVLAGLARL